ncbi:Pollen receptor-like kinase 1 [Dichanthelium oligosanthes]|uniref:Pollen receptor-like kinase 1 n=1 Tax=Dichanthelium oligosanthes TaxID=888268 RepID=A0A1E5VE55_9POAL|nr:Pollen receptor-like kinase 1 [Dichanthelium oligosanthes]
MAGEAATGRVLLAAAALVLALATVSTDAQLAEGAALLTFRNTLRGAGGGPPAQLDNWRTEPGPCPAGVLKSQWHGVTCHVPTRRVQILQLENLGLQGAAPDLGLLEQLQGLRSLSLANNNLTGAFPDLSAVPLLKFLFLSQNRLSGDIPDAAFAALKGLRTLDLSNNAFTGTIPSSITASGNRLASVNLANNNFSGPVPEGLQHLGAGNLNVQGNKLLCGPPVGTACPSSSPSSSASGSMEVLIIIAIVVVAIGALLAVAGIFAAVQARRNEPRYASRTETLGASPDAAKVKVTSAPPVKIEQKGGVDHQHSGAVTPAAGKRGGRRRDDHGKLVFVQEGRARFKLEDLLRASAEVLGSGNFGASYKTILLEGPSLVVKRFKDMNGVGREGFAEHMRRLGRLVHPNLLPVVAYLYKEEEKLLVTDYMVNGSLAHALHDGTRSSLPPLDWPKRLKIIKGVARGLAHLYEELPMLMVPHGHLKSSNVLLDAAFEPLLSDYALAPVVPPQHAAQVMVAYKSPECAAQGGRPGRKSDVWSLGILILEVLTGKFPANYLRQGRVGTDLAGWVHSVVREEWTGEVFDKDMRRTRSGEGEMVKLLKVGMGCCEPDVSRRWGLEEALVRIEELREHDAGDDSSTASSFVSEGEPAPAPASRPGEPQPHSHTE